MKSRIVCYRLEAQKGSRELLLAPGAEMLQATYHNGALALWVRLLEKEPGDPEMGGEPEPEPALERRVFQIFETGEVVEGRSRFLGTCAAPGGTFCFHITEKLDETEEAFRTVDLRSVDAARAALARQVARTDASTAEVLDELRSRIEVLESPTGESVGDLRTSLDASVRDLDSKAQALDDRISGVEGDFRYRIEELERRGPS